MDVISWAVGLIAGAALPLPRALLVAAGASVLIRVYQYLLPSPRAWGTDLPEDLIGAAAMIVVSCLLAYLGSIFRARKLQRAQGGAA